MPQVLIVDDDAETIEWLTEFARAEGLSVVTANTLRAARIQLTRRMPDVVLTDLVLPDGSGIELVDELYSQGSIQVVVITGQATVESAVAAQRAGATDYLTKPVEVDRLRDILRRVPKRVEPPVEQQGESDDLRKFGHILGSSPAVRRVYDQIARVAPTSATVLLVGESGTGKEVAAQTIHELSRRQAAPFLPINCGAVSPQLIESELFGHEKGSFTGADRQHRGFFERAHGGTLFLDEITEMQRELQVKLLRVLETGTIMRVGNNEPIEVNVRLVAATNRSPEKAVAEGRLREDLYHRLNVFPIRLPPLRERGTDIEMLAQHFLAELVRESGVEKKFSQAAIASLYAYAWPGNVRELKNYVHRAFILADDVIDVDLAPETFVPTSANTSMLTVRVGTTLEEANRRLINATLLECGNVKRKAAEILGISLKTLYNRLAAYNEGKPRGDDEDEPGGDERAARDSRERDEAPK